MKECTRCKFHNRCHLEPDLEDLMDETQDMCMDFEELKMTEEEPPEVEGELCTK